MQKVTRLGRRSALITLVSFGLAGCAAQVAEEQLSAGILPPVVNPITEINQTLRNLPPPSQKVPVAVYNYADQTGQFKPTEAAQTLSKAVTQGAASILVKALQDVGEGSWFTVVERERIDNLLKERQIIAQMRMTYLGEKMINPKALPPLLFAAIIFEGGIIGFDSNVQTGGVGARLLGIGGDIKYRLDTITIYLRAVSTKTGQVLASVTTHKTIASIGLQGGVFKFIAVDKILEAEAGFTKNEPDQLAVQQAIEKAVYSMLIEGAEKDVWTFADKDAQAKLIGAYQAGEAPPVLALTENSNIESVTDLPKKEMSEAAAAQPVETPSQQSAAIPEKAPGMPDRAKSWAANHEGTPSHQATPMEAQKANPLPAPKPWPAALTAVPPAPQPAGARENSSPELKPPPSPARRPWMTDIADIQDNFGHSTSRH